MTEGPRPCCAPSSGPATLAASIVHRPSAAERRTQGQVGVPAGTFAMGDAFDEGYPDDGEAPVHPVTLPGFWMDPTAVSNTAFASFVGDTGYVTDAERFGVSAVFHLTVRAEPRDILGRVAQTPWWLSVAGADWAHPFGRLSSARDAPQHPVVHVSFHDAQEYCRWAGKRLPTEAEWEYAGRGGLEGARFAWGDELRPRGRWMCNIWQGSFPSDNTEADGYLATAPVQSYRPNGYGLWCMAGNVWEWCEDWFSPGYYAQSAAHDPRGPAAGTGRVMRGGSFLCHDSYCNRYRVAARSSNTPDSSASNIGFRCANDAGNDEATATTATD
jgi:formylglycine-generating enzyme